ncbi:MAG: LysM peptidoglycan-binding domain-containing protein [Verrucomicrobia bacterium]|nr:LysM peptidoglycan-binding domain-containing protein [Verrucomicrobiota bacterium]
MRAASGKIYFIEGGRTISKSKTKTKTAAPTKSKSTTSTRYVVKKGDTLEKIARRYGISVSKLKSANGLKSGVVRTGRTLKIPR